MKKKQNFTDISYINVAEMTCSGTQSEHDFLINRWTRKKFKQNIFNYLH